MSDTEDGDDGLGGGDHHRLIFKHPTDGYTAMNFGSFQVHDDGSATATLADGSAEVKLSRSTEWVVGPANIVEGMKNE